MIRLIRNAGLITTLATPAMAAEPVTIAALGDSLTQGYGLPAEEGFVPQLSVWLEENGYAVEIINAGVSGDTTAGGLSRVDWTLTPEVDAMIVALGGNDVLRGIDPSISRSNLDGILKTAVERDLDVLLVGIDAPSNYGRTYEEDFEAIYPALAQEYDALLYPDFLAALTSQEDRTDTLERYMQADGIHPNAEGVALIVEAIGPKVAELIEQAQPGS